MRNPRIAATILSALLAAVPAGTLQAQSKFEKPVWETLLQKPLPEASEPKISVFSIPVSPAPPEPRTLGAGHTHAGPVFAYILEGEIENQVEPDPPEVYKSGGFFYEAPGHVHRFLHNLSTTEPAKLIVFQAGNPGQAAPAIKLPFREPLRSTRGQELSLFRLTLPAGARSEDHRHSGPGFVYVLEGKIEEGKLEEDPAGGRKTHVAGDLFLEPADESANGPGHSYRNSSDRQPAKLLLYQVNLKREPSSVP